MTAPPGAPCSNPGDTLSGLINQAGLADAAGKTVRAYNLAYPSMSIIKDLMILEKSLAVRTGPYRLAGYIAILPPCHPD